MTNGPDPVDMTEWNELVDAAKRQAKDGEIDFDEFNKKLHDLGMNPKEIEDEWNNCKV
jgi:hypothetical protein